MITGYLLAFLLTFLNFFVGLLPTVAFPAGLSTAITSISYYINAYSFLFPVSTLFTVLGLAFTFHMSILLWRLGNFIMHYIRGN